MEFLSKGGLIGHLAEKAKTDAGQKPSRRRAPAPPSGDRSLWAWFMYATTKRYADGKGRAHRKEYWGFNIGAFALMFAAAVIDLAGAGAGGYADAFGNYDESEATPIATALVWLALLRRRSRWPAGACTISVILDGSRQQ